MRPAGHGGDFDVVNRQPAVLEVDPEAVEATLHSQVLDDVVVEHPAHGKQDQPLAPRQPVLDELGDVVSPNASGRIARI
jgi:hypothetical protein